jgi:hypothetical protein
MGLEIGTRLFQVMSDLRVREVEVIETFVDNSVLLRPVDRKGKGLTARPWGCLAREKRNPDGYPEGRMFGGCTVFRTDAEARMYALERAQIGLRRASQNVHTAEKAFAKAKLAYRKVTEALKSTE